MNDDQRFDRGKFEGQLRWLHDECNEKKEESLREGSERSISTTINPSLLSVRKNRYCFPGVHTSRGVLCDFSDPKTDEIFGLAVKINTKEEGDGTDFWVREEICPRREVSSRRSTSAVQSAVVRGGTRIQ